jgi:RHS repeat-associated protein
MDDQQRIAVVETHTQGNDDSPKQLIRFQLSNHLGSASLELDNQGFIISYEEYYPYGSTSYQAGRNAAEVGLKRYRYTGKERDEESGFNYHSARYYLPWLGRWLNTDPIGLQGGINFYAYCRGNPISHHDLNGKQDHSTTAAGVTISSSGVSFGPFTTQRDQNVVAFGIAGSPNYMDTAERNTGLSAINIQDSITLQRSIRLGRGMPPGIPFFPSGEAAERTFADSTRPSGLSPMFSGFMTQEALEGNAASTLHFDMRGVTLTPPLSAETLPGFSPDDFHSSSEARQAVAHLASTGPGERNVSIVIQHEEGISTIPRGSTQVFGAPLPPRIAERLPNLTPPATPSGAPPTPTSGAPRPTGGSFSLPSSGAVLRGAGLTAGGVGVAAANTFVPGFAEATVAIEATGHTALSAGAGSLPVVGEVATVAATAPAAVAGTALAAGAAGYAAGDLVERPVTEATGSRTAGVAAGTVAGAATGAAVGAAVGVWFFGIGAAPAAAIGGVVGGAAGFIGAYW